MPERTLVTGALGCVGAWTLKALLDLGEEPVGYDLGGDDSRLRLVLDDDERARVTVVEGDVTNGEMLGRALGRIYPDKRPAAPDAAVVLDVRGLAAPGVRDASLQVRAGEIVALAGLIGEVVGVERARMTFTVEGGSGRFAIGETVTADMAPFTGATGNPTTLAETVFSTIPGSPVYASKASRYTRDGSAHGIPSVDLEGHNALQGHFKFAA